MSQLTQRQWLIIGGSVVGALVLISLAIAIVVRGGQQPNDPLAEPTVTLSELSPLNPITDTNNGYPPPTTESITPGFPITSTVAPITPTIPVAPTGATFTNLRVASSASAAPTNAFAAGTQEIWMLWDYNGMTENDRIERYWYHNNELYVRRDATWDVTHYGAVGTVSDIFLFNRAPQILPGDWRVELWLNGTKVLETAFTVAG